MSTASDLPPGCEGSADGESPPATIGILSPGQMGSGLGRAWQQRGVRVLTTVAGRSTRTRRLAAGLEILPSLADVVAQAEVIVSIGPPEHAIVMAASVVECCRQVGRRPIVADFNAIAPHTVQLISDQVAAAGCELVDGSISGPPPGTSTSTRLYLSGPAAPRLAGLAAPGLTTHLVGNRAGAASAIKMCTSSVYKGFTALTLQALLTARAHDVCDPVLADLREVFGTVMSDPARRIAVGAAKSDRYRAEMLEIAETQRRAGAQAALFEAMARVFEFVCRSELASRTPEEAGGLTDLEHVLAELGRRADIANV